MTDDKDQPPMRAKSLAEASERARVEAEARAKIRAPASDGKALSKETGGRAGPEPTRYGDWEKDGIISDF